MGQAQVADIMYSVQTNRKRERNGCSSKYLMSVPADPDPEQDPDDWREANEQDKADEAAS